MVQDEGPPETPDGSSERPWPVVDKSSTHYGPQPSAPYGAPPRSVSSRGRSGCLLILLALVILAVLIALAVWWLA